MTMSESTPCGNCNTPVAPENHQDFFGYCSYSCLKADQDRYESQQAAPERPTANSVFGPRNLL